MPWSIVSDGVCQTCGHLIASRPSADLLLALASGDHDTLVASWSFASRLCWAGWTVDDPRLVGGPGLVLALGHAEPAEPGEVWTEPHPGEPTPAADPSARLAAAERLLRDLSASLKRCPPEWLERLARSAIGRIDSFLLGPGPDLPVTGPERRQAVASWADENEVEVELFDCPDFDEAIIGVGQQACLPPVVVYSIPAMRDCLISDGLSEEDADDWLSHNTLAAFIGQGTPLCIWPVEQLGG